MANTLNPQQTVYLDLARGLATQLVLVQHLASMTGYEYLVRPWSIGSLGVTIFFILSGLLIGYTLQKPRNTPYGYSNFLIDRFARIFTCFVPALIFTAVVVYFSFRLLSVENQQHVTALQFIGNLLLIQDYPIFQILRNLHIDSIYFIKPYPIGDPYWTIPIEFWIYVFVGFAYFWVKGQALKNALFLGLFTISAIPFAYHTATGFGQCLVLTWLMGYCCAIVITPPERLTRFLAQRGISFGLFNVAAIGVVLFLMALRFASRGVNFYDLQTAFFLTLLFLLGLWLIRDLRWPSYRPIAASANLIARISYPLYLTHYPVIFILFFSAQWVKINTTGYLVVALASNLVAFGFWWLFDRHYKLVARYLNQKIVANKP